ncbi:hypothetical protein [Kitasatospora sp. NPDC058218]|uniref:hypothetical protein n=1 Tax=Kitasatospora sp. NPDC058218 TaxID=3346385 RepID=UPI0036D90D7A
MECPHPSGTRTEVRRHYAAAGAEVARLIRAAPEDQWSAATPRRDAPRREGPAAPPWPRRLTGDGPDQQQRDVVGAVLRLPGLADQRIGQPVRRFAAVPGQRVDEAGHRLVEVGAGPVDA